MMHYIEYYGTDGDPELRELKIYAHATEDALARFYEETRDMHGAVPQIHCIDIEIGVKEQADIVVK